MLKGQFTPERKKIQKSKRETRPFIVLLSASITLAMATLVGASSSVQVQELGPLAVPRTAHAAIALADGRVLITGGRDAAGTILSAVEVFDPSQQTSTAIAPLAQARANHTATLLGDGRVLIAGGTGARGALTSAEIFDPSLPSPSFRLLPIQMSAARSGHTATLLNNGKVLIAGGDDAGSAETFDPVTETFSSQLLTMKAPRIGHTATLLPDDRVLLAGGTTDSMEYFSSIDQTFTLDPQKMTAARTGHGAIALSDTRLLFLGGDTNHTIDEFNPSTDLVTREATMDSAQSSATLLANGKILVLRPDVAGIYAPDAVDQTTAFTPFDELSVPGSAALKRTGQTATELSADKKILVAGGVNAQSQAVAPVAVFNPARIWTDRDDYQPSDVVVLSGSGWKANENIYLFAVDSQSQAWTYGSTIQADADGAFVVNQYFIVQLVQDGVNFSVTALGAQSAMQAEVKFTDSTFVALSLSPTTQTTTAGTAATRTYTITAAFFNSPGSNTVNFAITWAAGSPPAGVTASPTPAPVTQPGGSGTQTSSLTLNTGANTPAGSYGFTVTGTPTSGQIRSVDGTLVVGQAPAFTSADNTTFTVNSAGSFAVTATGFPGPTFSVTAGTLPSGVTLTSGGLLSGTPAFGTAGTYTFTITAQNGITPNATQTFRLTVDKIQPTFTSLTASQTIAYGTATISLSGGLNAGSGVVPSGAATISVDSAPAATSSTFNGNLGNFTATVNANAIAASAVPYTITYNYAGDANFKSASDSSTTLTVNKASTSTAITSDTPDPSTNVQLVTVNYHVSVTAPGGGTPTGNVHVTDGVDSCDGTAAAGTCSLTLTTVGARTLTATYAGDANFNGSISAGQPHTVNSATVNTTTTVTSSSNPSTYGDDVTFTATVQAVSGSDAPTGTVQFDIAGVGTVAGTPGSTTSTTATWTYTTSALTASGSPHSVQASYTHTGNFNDSNGSLFGGQTVNKKTLTASIINDPTKPYDGNTTATLTSANFSLVGLVGTDNFTVTQATGTYNSKDVLSANTVTASLSASDFTPTGATLADNYNLPTTSSGPGDITAKTLTASIVKDPTKPYDGNTNATLTSANFSLAGLAGSENFTVTQTSGIYNSKDVAMATTITATLAEDDFTPTNGAVATNYLLPTSASGPGRITPVTLTASLIGNPTRQYNCGTAASLTPANFSLSGLVGTENFTVTQTAGTYNTKDVLTANTVTASLAAGDFTGTNGGVATNYVLPTTASGSGHIVPADASIIVTPYTSPTTVYNCNYRTATGSATGCDGDLSSLFDLSGTRHKDAGTYNGDQWTFNMGTTTNPNYQSASGTINDSIAKADATIDVSAYQVTYNCNAHTATGTATGKCSDDLSSLLDLSGTNHTNTGNYSDSWSFAGNNNYNSASGTVDDIIDKANTTSSVTSNINPSTIGQTVTFTATAAGNPAVTCNPTGTVTFKDGSTTLMAGVSLSGGSASFSTSSLSAGNHSITAVYSGDGNFNASTSPIYTQSVHYVFVGFLQPIDNLPIVNSATAGQTIPVKWQVKDSAGNLIGDLSTLAPNGLQSQRIACDIQDPIDAIEELAAPGSTVFRFDGTQFIYNWQTSKSWAGTCRLMTVTLADGTVLTAQFTFK
jgi:Bacterial Ig-like domain (group 3)/YDG domain/Galactose oxidase, central domain